MGRIGVKAQSVTAYVVLSSAVIAALISLQVYFSRSLQGRYKQYSDSLASGSQLFSSEFSSYKKIKETIGGIDSGSGRTYGFVDRTEIRPSGEQITTQQTVRANRVISGRVNTETKNGDEFFSSGAPQELKDGFADVPIKSDYYIEEQSSVVDDFSDKKLVEDRLFGEGNETEGEDD